MRRWEFIKVFGSAVLFFPGRWPRVTSERLDCRYLSSARARHPHDPVARDQLLDSTKEGHGSHSAFVEPGGNRRAQSANNDRFSDTSSRYTQGGLLYKTV